MDIPWTEFSVSTAGWLLVAVFVVGLLRGRLVPRSVLDDAIHDRDEWRAESRVKDQQLAEQASQLGHLAEVGETQKAVLGALSRIAGTDLS